MADNAAANTVWVGFRAILANIRDVVIGVTTVGIVVAFLLRPLTDPYIKLPETLDGLLATINEQNTKTMARLDALEAGMALLPREAPPPFLEVETVSVFPAKVTLPAHVEVVYSLRRNRSCDTVVEVRFWSLSGKTYAPDLIRRIPAVEAPVSFDYVLWTLRLPLPDTLTPGVWAYQPRILCPNERYVVPPPAYFEVEA